MKSCFRKVESGKFLISEGKEFQFFGPTLRKELRFSFKPWVFGAEIIIERRSGRIWLYLRNPNKGSLDIFRCSFVSNVGLVCELKVSYLNIKF